MGHDSVSSRPGKPAAEATPDPGDKIGGAVSPPRSVNPAVETAANPCIEIERASASPRSARAAAGEVPRDRLPPAEAGVGGKLSAESTVLDDAAGATSSSNLPATAAAMLAARETRVAVATSLPGSRVLG